MNEQERDELKYLRSVIAETPDKITPKGMARFRELDSIDASERRGEAIKGAGITTLDGMMFGGLDELAGALDAAEKWAYSKVSGGEPVNFADAYANKRDEIHNYKSQFANENPGMAVAAGLAGGITSGTGILGNVMRSDAIKNVPTAIKVPAAGAGLGAVGGLLYNNDDRAGGAATGSVFGGALSAATLPLSYLASRLFSPVYEATRGAKTLPRRKLNEAIGQDDLTPEQVIKNLEDLGPNSVIADAGGENVLGLARGAAAYPGKAKNTAVELAQKRQGDALTPGRFDRIEGSAKANLSNKGYYDTIDDLTTIKREQAGPLYRQAFQQEIPLNNELKAILNTDAAKRAWGKARNIASNEGEALPNVFDIDAAGNIVGIKEVPNMKAWHYIKQGLDDVVADHMDDFGRIRGSEGHSVDSVRRRLLEQLEKNELYKEAKSIYGGAARAEEALKKGRAIFNEDVELSVKAISKMDEFEKEAFRTGVVQAIISKHGSKTYGSNPITAILNKPGMVKKLKAAFPDDASYSRFVKDIQNESRMAYTESKINQGSPTARIEGEKSALGQDPGSLYALSQGNPLPIFGNMMRSIDDRLQVPTKKIAEGVSDDLLTMDRQKQLEVLRTLNQYPLLMQPGTRQGLKASIGGVPGGLLGQ